MKGVSAVIAVILILMIVVALAALAYTWFTGIFSSLTETTGESITSTTESMQLQFAIDSVSCDGSDLEVTVRNTGTGALTADNVGIYLNGGVLLHSQSASIPEGTIYTFDQNDLVGCGCAVDDVVRVTIENGVSNSVTIKSLS